MIKTNVDLIIISKVLKVPAYLYVILSLIYAELLIT